MKIIHIIDHLPAYEEHGNKPRPAINWDTPDGSWVGMAGGDWFDLIAKVISEKSNNISCEVWQVDARADKIYSHTFPEGFVHRNFPAIRKYYYYGYKKTEYISSPSMLNELGRQITPETIIHLPFPVSFISRKIIKEFRDNKIVCTSLGDFVFFIDRLFVLNKNILSKFNLIYMYLQLKKSLKYIDALTYINHHHLNKLEKIFNKKKILIPMGVDFNRWIKKDKKSCRRKLNLPIDKMIFFSSSRLNALKQVDKFIQVLNKFAGEYDFLYLVSGHGKREYESFLQQQASPLILKNQIKFIGYVSEEELLDYYNASDLFVLTSLSEGSPVGVQKAFACGTPVFTTNVGYTAELLEKYNEGLVCEKNNYDEWGKKIKEILIGEMPKPFDIMRAKEYFDWQNIGNQFLNLFKSI